LKKIIIAISFLFLTSSCIPETSIPLRQNVIITVQKINIPKDTVILYSAPWCGWCQTAKKFLIDNKITFIEKDFENKAVKEQLKLIAKQIGYEGTLNAIPLFVVNDRIIVGYDPIEVLHALGRNSGKSTETSMGMSVVYE